jgi:ribose 5-phosphate isomerase B
LSADPVRLVVVADHNGESLQDVLVEWLRGQGHVVSQPAGRSGEVVDYPPLCSMVCRSVLDGTADYGLVIGGTGQGEHIACNKFPGVRASLCDCLLTAEIGRAHNNANVLVLGAKLVTPAIATEILDRWLATPFKGGAHQRRLDQIAAIERGERL